MQHVRACMEHDTHDEIVITEASVAKMMQARPRTPGLAPCPRARPRACPLFAAAARTALCAHRCSRLQALDDFGGSIGNVLSNIVECATEAVRQVPQASQEEQVMLALGPGTCCPSRGRSPLFAGDAGDQAQRLLDDGEGDQALAHNQGRLPQRQRAAGVAAARRHATARRPVLLHGPCPSCAPPHLRTPRSTPAPRGPRQLLWAWRLPPSRIWQVHGAVYDIFTGEVEWLGEHPELPDICGAPLPVHQVTASPVPSPPLLSTPAGSGRRRHPSRSRSSTPLLPSPSPLSGRRRPTSAATSTSSGRPPSPRSQRSSASPRATAASASARRATRRQRRPPRCAHLRLISWKARRPREHLPHMAGGRPIRGHHRQRGDARADHVCLRRPARRALRAGDPPSISMA